MDVLFSKLFVTPMDKSLVPIIRVV